MRYSIIILSLAFLLSCNNIKYPEYIGTKNTRVENLSLKQATLRTDLEYRNPNNFGIEIKETDLKVYVEGEYIGDAEQPQPIKIGAKSNFLFPLSVKFDGTKILSKALSLMFSKEIKYRVAGTAKVGKGNMYIKVPVNFEDKYIITK